MMQGVHAWRKRIRLFFGSLAWCFYSSTHLAKICFHNFILYIRCIIASKLVHNMDEKRQERRVTEWKIKKEKKEKKQMRKDSLGLKSETKLAYEIPSRYLFAQDASAYTVCAYVCSTVVLNYSVERSHPERVRCLNARWFVQILQI